MAILADHPLAPGMGIGRISPNTPRPSSPRSARFGEASPSMLVLAALFIVKYAFF